MPRPAHHAHDLWATVYRDQNAALVTYALALAGNPSDAEDLIHDVFTRLVRKRRTPPDDPLAYAMRALRNHAVTLRRRRHREHPTDHAAFLALPETMQTPDPALDQRDTELRDALGQLTAVQRETLVLHLYIELTFEQIGAILELPRGTVSSHYTRALQRLRKHLDRIEPPAPNQLPL